MWFEDRARPVLQYGFITLDVILNVWIGCTTCQPPSLCSSYLCDNHSICDCGCVPRGGERWLSEVTRDDWVLQDTPLSQLSHLGQECVCAREP